ncbi:UNVERIFIED_CONTAM: hypothetical protein HDU68_001295 [Siphonaria sp. JEL0065]|nr:hypothetical protein HDU68_001295 [Siphonaria sp. JEL0065]
MGAAPSKQPETIEFKRPEGEGPVTVSLTPNMLRSLRGLAPEAGSKGVKGKQSLDEVVQNRVQRELELQQQRKLNYEKLNSDLLLREAEDLMRRQKIAPVAAEKEHIVAKEKALVECYKNNTGRTLDCWKEVEDLKKAVASAQKDFFTANV